MILVIQTTMRMMIMDSEGGMITGEEEVTIEIIRGTTTTTGAIIIIIIIEVVGEDQRRMRDMITTSSRIGEEGIKEGITITTTIGGRINIILEIQIEGVEETGDKGEGIPTTNKTNLRMEGEIKRIKVVLLFENKIGGFHLFFYLF